MKYKLYTNIKILKKINKPGEVGKDKEKAKNKIYVYKNSLTSHYLQLPIMRWEDKWE